MYNQTTVTASHYPPNYAYTADQWLCDTLISIGILPNLSGYHHICRAVMLTAEAKRRFEVGHLYEQLSDEFDASPTCIERNIRNAINCSYRMDRLWHLNKILNVEVLESNNQLLSNTQFISLLAHYYTQKKNQITMFNRSMSAANQPHRV